jgi:hypothetical protein
MHHKMLALVAGAAISVLMLAPDTALARGGFGGFGSGHFAGFHGARLGHFGGAHFGGFGGGRGNTVVRPAPVPRPWP